MQGHRRREVVDEYTRQLKEDYRVNIIQQPPCPPDVNTLDTGIWMSLHSAV
jgi:hypothetical protein